MKYPFSRFDIETPSILSVRGTYLVTNSSCSHSSTILIYNLLLKARLLHNWRWAPNIVPTYWLIWLRVHGLRLHINWLIPALMPWFRCVVLRSNNSTNDQTGQCALLPGTPCHSRCRNCNSCNSDNKFFHDITRCNRRWDQKPGLLRQQPGVVR